ncbi:MAG: hypothetical protein JWN62_2981 [Acidimicrobiales bacterium]|nr:hypothetical protein [Acidimicrobiales bacterium]
MATLSFRDRFYSPKVARAVLSPFSILLFGVVTAIGIVVGLPIVAAVGIGVIAYVGKVAFAIPRNPDANRIDPFALKDPWRSYVQSALTAKLRFDRTVATTSSGPLKDHLKQLASRLQDGIEESWRIASRGNDIDGALANLNTAQAEAELKQLQMQQQQAGSADVASTIESLQAQISSGTRMQQVSMSTRNRLRLLDARFDELVARAVEVSVGSGDSDVLGNDVNDLVNDLEGLRLAIDDTRRAETGDLSADGTTLPSSGVAPPASAPPEADTRPRPQTQPPQ